MTMLSNNLSADELGYLEIAFSIEGDFAIDMRLVVFELFNVPALDWNLLANDVFLDRILVN